MNRLLAKLPRSSSGSRDASASSGASRLPFDIFEVSMTDVGAGFSGSPPDESVSPRRPDFALVSSAICRSGASNGVFTSLCPSGNVTLHPFNSGAAATLRACPERAQRVERETSLDVSEIVGDSSTPLGMTVTRLVPPKFFQQLRADLYGR